MIIVDTHCQASPSWFEPAEILLDQMSRNGVEKATPVQIAGAYDKRNASHPYTDYRKVLGLAKYSNIFMVVPGLGELCPRPRPLR